MENLRAQIRVDLHESIEGEWGIPVALTDPDGTEHIYNKLYTTERLKAQVLNYTKREDPATGETVVVPQVVVVLAEDSLPRVPVDGEFWFIKVLNSLAGLGADVAYVFTTDRAREHGGDIGFVRLYQQLVENEIPVVPST